MLSAITAPRTLPIARSTPQRTPQQGTEAPASDSVTLSGGPEPTTGSKALASLAGSCGALAGYLGGVLYVGTVVGPIIVGALKAGAEPESLEAAIADGEQPSAKRVLEGSASLAGSIGKEFLAPLTWAHEGFQEMYGLLA